MSEHIPRENTPNLKRKRSAAADNRVAYTTDHTETKRTQNDQGRIKPRLTSSASVETHPNQRPETQQIHTVAGFAPFAFGSSQQEFGAALLHNILLQHQLRNQMQQALAITVQAPKTNYSVMMPQQNHGADQKFAEPRRCIRLGRTYEEELLERDSTVVAPSSPASHAECAASTTTLRLLQNLSGPGMPRQFEELLHLMAVVCPTGTDEDDVLIRV